VPQAGPIIVVEQNRQNLELMVQVLEEDGFEVLGATGLDDVDQVLSGLDHIRLALADVSGLDHGIWARCMLINDKAIPLVLIFPSQAAVIAYKPAHCRVDAILVKPMPITQLLCTIRSILTGQADYADRHKGTAVTPSDRPHGESSPS
jgi:DNA-binding response OmpR family regulator